MARIFFSVALLITWCCGSVALGAVLSGPVVNPANGNSYYLLETASWTASESEAIGLGGHLATITDAAENAWVASVFSNYGGTARDLWLGLNDASVEGNYAWASGETVGYTNWNPGEPNDADGLEDYVYLIGVEVYGLTAGKWNDIPHSGGVVAPLYGVVEVVVPEPASFTLLMLASTLLTNVRLGRRALV